jgi:hypothetical protein
MARKFFYVAAGLLMLALAYHLGASTAGAEAARAFSTAHIGTVGQDGAWAGVFDRVVVACRPGSEVDPLRLTYVTDPLPGTSPILTVNGEARSVILANGDVYTWGDSWSFRGNMLANVLSATAPSRASGLGLEIDPGSSRSSIAVAYLVGRESQVDVELLDVHGRVIQQQTEHSVPPGKHQVVISLQSGDRMLEPGTYFVRVHAGAEFETTKAIVLR